MNILVSACLLGVCCRYNGTGEENERVMRDDDVRAPFDRLIADVLERVKGDKDLLDLLFAAAAEQADVVPVLRRSA